MFDSSEGYLPLELHFSGTPQLWQDRNVTQLKQNSTGGCRSWYISCPLNFGGGVAYQFRRSFFGDFRRLRGLFEEVEYGRKTVQAPRESEAGFGQEWSSKEKDRLRKQAERQAQRDLAVNDRRLRSKLREKKAEEMRKYCAKKSKNTYRLQTLHMLQTLHFWWKADLFDMKVYLQKYFYIYPVSTMIYLHEWHKW